MLENALKDLDLDLPPRRSDARVNVNNVDEYLFMNENFTQINCHYKMDFAEFQKLFK